jgi:hypothetical protein
MAQASIFLTEMAESDLNAEHGISLLHGSLRCALLQSKNTMLGVPFYSRQMRPSWNKVWS